MNAQRPNYVVLGRIAGLYGVKGWLKVISYTRPRINLLAYDKWWLYMAGDWQPFICRASREHGKSLVASIEGIDDRDQARTVIGAEIGVPRDRLPPLSAGEYYWHDLIGLNVVTREGTWLGPIVRLEETGGHDVLVVREPGAVEEMIPYVPGIYVLEVDPDRGTVTVDWPASGPE